MLMYFLIFISAVLFYIKLIRPLSIWERRGVPHHKPWPIVGNMSAILFRQISFPEGLISLAKDFKDRRYFGFHQFSRPTLTLLDADLIKQIGIKDFESFLDHPGFVSEEIDPIFGKNLFSLRGQRWRHMRSTLSPAFTSSKMRNMFNLISECAEQFTSHFLEECKNSNEKYVTIEMKDTFARFANDVIATCAFGIKCDSLKEKENVFYKYAKRATDFSGLRSLLFFAYTISETLMKLFKVRLFEVEVSNFFKNVVLSTMKEREEKKIYRPDMIHLLIEARKGKLKYDETAKSKEEDAGFATVEESEVGKQNHLKVMNLSDDDVTAQALIFFFAGFDTTSTFMSFMSHELAINPDIQKRLQEEIDSTFETCNGKLNYDAVTKMKYLDMVICESLRKWPPAVITDRMCTRDYTIKPVLPDEKPLTIYKGETIWILPFVFHRNPKYFPNPEKFDPERFNDDNKHKINPNAYIPFGVGPRNCIGSRFALLEGKIIFCHILRKFNIVITKKSQIPLKLSRSTNPIATEKGIWYGLEPRK